MRWSLIPLGVSSGMPIRDRHVSAMALASPDRWWLFDCGEGTQYQVMRTGLRWQLLEAVFISHLHGDHLFGLPGLLNTMSLLGRQRPLDIYGPPQLGTYLSASLEYGSNLLRFPLHLHEAGSGVLPALSDPKRGTEAVLIESAPLEHRVPSFGYAVTMTTPRETLKVAYCLDTRPCESAVRLAQGSDVLVHEATYANDLIEKAYERGHSTAYQVGLLASRAQVSLLVLTHFSPRYQDLAPLVQEAREAFPRTLGAEELSPIPLETRGSVHPEPSPGMVFQ